ncbi:hypothetical protein [Fibrobacter sp.]
MLLSFMISFQIANIDLFSSGEHQKQIAMRKLNTANIGIKTTKHTT